jgi:hypothetical protein
LGALICPWLDARLRPGLGLHVGTPRCLRFGTRLQRERLCLEACYGLLRLRRGLRHFGTRLRCRLRPQLRARHGRLRHGLLRDGRQPLARRHRCRTWGFLCWSFRRLGLADGFRLRLHQLDRQRLHLGHLRPQAGHKDQRESVHDEGQRERDQDRAVSRRTLAEHNVER